MFLAGGSILYTPLKHEKVEHENTGGYHTNHTMLRNIAPPSPLPGEGGVLDRRDASGGGGGVAALQGLRIQ